MKKIFLNSFLLLAWFIVSVSNVKAQTQLTKEVYLQKSKQQKTAAWILLGGGAALATAGGIWWSQTFTIFGETSSEESTAGALVAIGGVAMLSSIPLFISSAKNKGRAESVTVNLKFEKLMTFQKASVKNSNYPAISVRIPLR